MRTYVLTDAEVREIKAYLAGGPKTANLPNIRYRAKKNLATIEGQVQLLKQLLAETPASMAKTEVER